MPPGAVLALLLPLLGGCRPDDGQALRLIFAAERESNVAALAKHLDHPSLTVSGAAMRRLVRLRKPTADAALKRALGRLEVGQRRALLASLLDSRRADPGAQTLLAQLARDAAPLVRRTTVLGLGDLPGALDRALWKILLEELAARQPSRWRAAATAIEARRWKAVVPLARALAARRNNPVAGRIRRLLGRITGYHQPPAKGWSVWAGGAEARMLALVERGRWPRDRAAILAVLDDSKAGRPAQRAAARALARLAPTELGLKLLLARPQVDLAAYLPLWGKRGEGHLERWVAVKSKQLGSKLLGPARFERLVRGILALERSPKHELLASLVDERHPRVAVAALSSLDRLSRRRGPLPAATLAKLRSLARGATGGQPSPLAVATTLLLWRSGEQPPRVTAVLAGALSRAAAKVGQGSERPPLEQQAHLSNLISGLAELAAWFGDSAASQALVVALKTKLATLPAFASYLAAHLDQVAQLVDLSASLEQLVTLAARPSARLRRCWGDVALTIAIQGHRKPALLRLATLGLSAGQWRRIFRGLAGTPGAVSEAMLRKALGSPQESVRIVALEEAPRQALVAVADRVLELLKTGSRAQRLAAVMAAAKVKQKRFVAPLRALFDAADRDAQRTKIALALARCGDVGKLTWVVKQLGGKYPTLFASYSPPELLLLLEDRGKLPASVRDKLGGSKAIVQAAIRFRREANPKTAEKLVQAAGWSRGVRSAALAWLRDSPARVPLLIELERLAVAKRRKVAKRRIWRVLVALIRPGDWAKKGPAVSPITSLRRLAAHASTTALERYRINRALALAAGPSRLARVASELAQLRRPAALAPPPRAKSPGTPAVDLQKRATASRLNSLAWSIALRLDTATKPELLRALRFSAAAVKRSGGMTAAYLDTLALVQYRLGRRQAAVRAQLRAARLSGVGVGVDYILRLRAYVGGTLATGREAELDADLLRWAAPKTAGRRGGKR
jgi:hypothetical protein